MELIILMFVLVLIGELYVKAIDRNYYISLFVIILTCPMLPVDIELELVLAVSEDVSETVEWDGQNKM